MFRCVSQCLVPFASLTSRSLSTATRHTDVAIVGAGHNGLVAALLLARQGLKVPKNGTIGSLKQAEQM